ncbi:helix-turn-helix domain-containing protein [Neolewinella maritima]|nr:helix-turn-helix domain-containing protein [Neolewinella maritima]
MRTCDQRLRELIHTIGQVTFNQLDEGLVGYVQKRAELSSDLTIQTTHKEIADELHVSREAISRLLKILEQRGGVMLGRNRVQLLKTPYTNRIRRK